MSEIANEVIADSDKRKKKKDLGIFYTPVEVVDFIFSLLKIHKERQKERWEHNGKHKFPSVIDPAAGEGIFLKRAVQSGFTNATHIFGLDIDKEAVEKWKTIHLLTEVFNGDEAALKRHFFHQNGLVPVQWEQHKEFYKGLKKSDIENERFDAVVGNPPYGGIGVDFTDSKTSPEEMELLDSLQSFELLRYKKFGAPPERNKPGAQGSLFGEPKAEYNARLPLTEIARIAQSIPVESLFIERFIQLAKPGGWVAMIIPDGILSNGSFHFLRQFVADKCCVRAIVSLPRETFKHVKTNAKTSVLLLEKGKEDSNMDYRVFLADIAKFNIQAFDLVIKQYHSFMQTGKLCDIKSAKKK